MDETSLESKLNELVKEVGGIIELPYKNLSMPSTKGSGGHKQLQKSIDRLSESIDYLRICIKYQLFDLEATRRENKYLRKILEEKEI